MTHWKTTYDPDDGTPIGELCDCGIGGDHDGTGNLMFPDGDAGAEGERAGSASV